MTSTDLFDYELPENLIAQRPLEKRDQSRMMILARETRKITDGMFTSFPDYLRKGDTLVINTTKVFPARLLGSRKTGGKVEALLIRGWGNGLWSAMIGGLKKLNRGETIYFGDGEAFVKEKHSGGYALLQFESEKESIRLTQRFGDIPLPPYINRPGSVADKADKKRYQTVFADSIGSCAAPTAGLHFTDEALTLIQAHGVRVAEVVLHVGPGTFRPVRASNIEDHEMDAEAFHVPEETVKMIEETKNNGGRVVAVGSTSTRALESLSVADGKTLPCSGSTRLFITPGYRFKLVDAMLTNFHLPKSTLLMLVCAFARREFVLRAYAHAVSEKYRFFSYGDAMLIV
ncbi:S-adenosylmethionine:tRNA ribosyltransferase-isomerase [hydrothermal vent metagenome]|uniref:S-adenosylmethionine:tRNA ribosyltransferase-isomerase n=1 Tax=hydrothermal vent metagenome TaxID=652676 RepID=A0A3B1C5R6_9ZZZZ